VELVVRRKSWDIDDLLEAYAEETGSKTNRSQINRYLKEGILPQPDEGGAFGESHLERLRMIDYLRSRYGMSLREISGLFGVITGTNKGETKDEPEEDRQAIDRRERILENASELFAAKGYHGTTIDEIVQATGIAKGTFYIYFDSKEELLVEVIKKLIDKTLERIDREMEEKKEIDAVALIEVKGQAMLELYLKNSELLYMLLGEAVGNPRLMNQVKEVYEQLTHRLVEDLEEGVEEGKLFPYEDLKTISYALVGMGQAMAILLTGSDELQLGKTRRTVHEFIRRAFSRDLNG
jgi:AcrR family transcriptional regulator